MLYFARRIVVGALLLLVIPLLVWASGWQWKPELSGWWLRPLFWITETVSAPWGFLTALVLSAWFLWRAGLGRRQALALWCVLIGTITLGQVVVECVKVWVQEPRPFVVWLERAHQIAVQDFYTLPGSARGELVAAQLQQATSLPDWLKLHWQKGSGYAFPSGHAMFVASWALLAAGVLGGRHRYGTVALLMLWAVAVMISRLVLGMHWPRDLVASTIISALLSMLAGWWLLRRGDVATIGEPLRRNRTEHGAMPTRTER
ncbi:phosphatidylglycerophosphatase B [Musicola keenii]|uniref:phosphatidylglycerophosphatase B n=1 Tax=Musicola keenii TaxID=2884250 RepID=UPI001785E118|nr:phosphatidylglycerophosphatase B [Musicola keenii]